MSAVSGRGVSRRYRYMYHAPLPLTPRPRPVWGDEMMPLGPPSTHKPNLRVAKRHYATSLSRVWQASKHNGVGTLGLFGQGSRASVPSCATSIAALDR